MKDLTGGGAHAVIDFVGELGAEQLCGKMLRQGGTHFIVGYGGTIEIPTIETIAGASGFTKRHELLAGRKLRE